MTVLAHVGHWYHSLLYVAPIILIALALWWSGRRADRSAPSEEGGSESREAHDHVAGAGDGEPDLVQRRAEGS